MLLFHYKVILIRYAKFLPAALALVLATESVSKTTNRGTAGLSNVYSESLW